jgi:hypothetical protein
MPRQGTSAKRSLCLPSPCSMTRPCGCSVGCLYVVKVGCASPRYMVETVRRIPCSSRCVPRWLTGFVVRVSSFRRTKICGWGWTCHLPGAMHPIMLEKERAQAHRLAPAVFYSTDLD